MVARFPSVGDEVQGPRLEGGQRARPCVRVLVFDADMWAAAPGFDAALEFGLDGGLSAFGSAPETPTGLLAVSAEEAGLLRQLEGAGVALVCVTAASETEARSVFATLGVHPVVLSDEQARWSSLGHLSRAAARLDAFLVQLDKTPASLGEVCAIAAWPVDCDLLLEAGTAFALEGAGYRSCAAADEVFQARKEGGLALALARALEATSIGAAAAGF